MSEKADREQERLTRRDMLRRSAVGAAALGLGTSVSEGAADELGPAPAMRSHGVNGCVNVGVIGCGGRGTWLLNEVVRRARGNAKLRVLAVCDVYEPRKQQALNVIKKGNTGKESDGLLYHEYERMLENPDVDAVVIGTPDHWHAKIAIEAIKAGKDVYVEKPMTHTIPEAKALRDVAAWAGAVVQVGAGSASDPTYHQAREMIRRGAIGKVIWTRSGYSRNVPAGDWNYYIEPQASPKNLDWKRWVGWEWGLAAKKPFNAEHYFRFRKYWDYSGGIATDLLYHALAHLAVALGPEFPSRVVASGGNWVHKDRDVPDTFLMNIDYPSEHSVFLMGTDANDTGVPEVIQGQHASMTFGGPKVEPQQEFVKEFEEAKKRGALDVPRPNVGDHIDNWLECLRTREKPNCDVELGYRVQVAITSAVMAYRQGRAVLFDPKTHKVSTA
ncbi:MAG: Gfo/Idh/MocA family oxidoreductase [Phycisphaerae bacterium]|nr:Gfo/Idh/MocA family oxidoreductase [Phycisphaerae bacterium]